MFRDSWLVNFVFYCLKFLVLMNFFDVEKCLVVIVMNILSVNINILNLNIWCIICNEEQWLNEVDGLMNVKFVLGDSFFVV